MVDDLVHRYVRFIFSEWEADPRGWITKTPPTVAEFASQYDEPDMVVWFKEMYDDEL